MPDYSIGAVADALAVDPGDVRAVLVGVDEDPLPEWAVTEVHAVLEVDGVRTVPEAFLPGLVLGETWATLGRDVDDSRTV